MIPVSGISPVTPPTMMKAWIASVAVSPAARSFEKPSSASMRDLEAAVDEEEVEEDDRRRAGEAELLRDRGVDEVRLEEGDVRVAVGRQEHAAAEPLAEEAAARDRVDRLDELVRVVLRVAPRVEPDRDPLLRRAAITW